MLSSAAKAVQTLSGRSLDANIESMHPSEAIRNSTMYRAAFESNAKAYYEMLQAICARLNRQAHALEEAGIIDAEAPILTLADTRRNAVTGGAVVGAGASTESERIRNGGLGNFDVGWLNSRGNKVGAEMEAEVISRLMTLGDNWQRRIYVRHNDQSGQDEDSISMAGGET